MAIAQSGTVRRLVPLVVLSLAVLQVAPASGEQLASPREVARGGYVGPRFAPDGHDLLVTGAKMSGLYLIGLADGSARRLVADPGAGVHARWTGAGVVEYRALRAGAQRDLVVDRTGRVSAASTSGAPRAAYTRDDRMYVVDQAGIVTRIGTGDRFFGAVVSPDGDKVAFQGLSTGIYVHVRSTGSLEHVGPGTAPSWSPDGSRLVFEVTEDDGHDIVASDLYLYEVSADRVARLTSTDAMVERRPSFSPDGTRVAFDDDRGAIFVGLVSTTEEGR